MQSNENNVKLIRAIEKDDLKELKDLLDAGIDINAKIKMFYTPLTYAIVKNRPKILKAILEAGADVNQTLKYVYNPLELASRQKNKELLEISLLHLKQKIENSSSAKDKYNYQKLINTFAPYLN